MEREIKQAYTRRLSQCNKGEMIVIIYDIFFTYTSDAKKALLEMRWEDYKENIRKAQKTLDKLMGALDFRYDVSKSLYALYNYCKVRLAKAMYEREEIRIEEAEKIMVKLHKAFIDVAKKDTSNPLMSNTQQVYAGMTYGRNELTESSYDTNRGFLV